MTFYNAPGTKLGMIYRLYDGKKIVAVAQPLAPDCRPTGRSRSRSTTPPSPGKTYTLTVDVNDKHGHTREVRHHRHDDQVSLTHSAARVSQAAARLSQ